MDYSARWFSDGTYFVGDEEYGYELCRVDFTKELQDKLSSSQQDELASRIARLISKTLTDKAATGMI